MSLLQENAHDLEQELAWLARLLDARFKLYFDMETDITSITGVEPPAFEPGSSPYSAFLFAYNLNFAERVAIVLALAPYLRPQLLDVFFTQNKTFGRRFTEFGGVVRNDAFWPTLETLAFVLGGTGLAERLSVQAMFEQNHFFIRDHIMRISVPNTEPILHAPLFLSDMSLGVFTTGQSRRMDYSVDFPARHIQTDLTWDDLILHPGTLKQIGEIETWLRHGDTLLHEWAMASKLRPGHRCLFYGPPGTGKTMTACLLGRTTNRDVYKVDLSLIVSKYIGETEKNLAKVFDHAERRNWILFFDEADALFGKRSETKDAHDRYANQEVSYLLQRIETFDGLVILASNRRDDLDEAFARRFESMIYFPVPRPTERLQLWQNGFSDVSSLDADLNLDEIARDHALTGGAIMNVVRYASLQALSRDDTIITLADVSQGIRREYAKEGKSG